MLRTLEGHQGAVYSVAFDPQGGMLASGGLDQTVKLWEVRSGKLLRTLEGHQGVVRSVAFDPQGATLASASDDKTVKLWEARSGKLLRTLKGHQDWVRSVAFDPQGATLASGSYDNTVKLWEAQSGKLLRTLEGHTGAVDIVASHERASAGLEKRRSDNPSVELRDMGDGRIHPGANKRQSFGFPRSPFIPRCHCWPPPARSQARRTASDPG